jgi:hypothetical protein
VFRIIADVIMIQNKGGLDYWGIAVVLGTFLRRTILVSY